MKDVDFTKEVERILDDIAQTIEDKDQEGLIEVDLNSGILTIGTEAGIFVINKQSAAKEIWLSSPISGPYHFAFKDGQWLSRNGAELFDVLTKELKIEIKDTTPSSRGAR